MTKQKLSRAMKLFGTDSLVGKKRVLTAGPISAILDNGALRYVTFQGVEVLRGISYLVRDKNWGTTAATLENVRVKQGKDSFAVSYSATCRDATQALTYDATIEGLATGVVRFHAKATPLTDVVTNRTGFVVLHPLDGLVGAPVDILHRDGSKQKTRFPRIISPGQPVFEIRSLKHTVMPGVTATVVMEGNKFEMEDHRNWMDASYKTYVCSLLDPWPYTLKAGEPFEQSITVKIEGKPKGKSAKAASAITVSLGALRGRVPSIGVGVPMAEAAATLAAVDHVVAAQPTHLLCQIDGRKAGVSDVAARFHTLKQKTGKPVTLEIVLPAKAAAMLEVAEIADAVRAGNLMPNAIVITQMHDLKSFQPNTPRPWGPSYEEMAAAVRQHFPGIPVGGGMASFFTELNRKPVPKGLFDFVTHSVCPIVHLADDQSVMETLQSMPSITSTTRHMIGKTPYHIGPSSIACRDNPYGAEVAANPDNVRVCLSDHDPRQRGVYAAAWTVALVAAAARGGVDAITLGAFTGKQGVIVDDGFVPAYHVIAGLAGASGARRLNAVSTAPSKVEVLAYQTKDNISLWLANLTGEAQIVKVKGFTGPCTVHAVDVDHFNAMSRNASYMTRRGLALRKLSNVTLSAYAAVRVQSEKIK
jgi:D-apionolactonase